MSKDEKCNKSKNVKMWCVVWRVLSTSTEYATYMCDGFFSEIAIQFDSLNNCNPHHICREIIIKVLFP